ncbi:hypothetical protein CDL12_09393 [Handroanthus impetiginosus]|uniref:Uncharacterized protein n=1 Tax=Handroanthus impetiginosus TaxID=429701 RepID=A0A2G9HKJ5_9LAMI|nr:hypothetical protein CDL12_09393 [Handroanthus impetiginosus]
MPKLTMDVLDIQRKERSVGIVAMLREFVDEHRMLVVDIFVELENVEIGDSIAINVLLKDSGVLFSSTYIVGMYCDALACANGAR